MFSMQSMRKLILESNAKDLYEREETDHCEHKEHKRKIFDIVDTITTISAENSTILQINWSEFNTKFDTIYTTQSDLNISMLRTIMQTNLADYLVNIPVFDKLQNSKLELMSRLCHYQIAKEGAVICKEGDQGEEVFILLSGEVKVETMASERMVELFEKGILSPLERVKSSMSIEDNTMRELQKRKSSMNFKSDYDLVSQSCSQKILIKRRQTILRAGYDSRREKMKMSVRSMKSDDHDTYARRTSRLDIPDPNHSVELARLKAGDYFGEISTFLDLPRAASVTATTNALMVSISKRSFRTLYQRISPELEKDAEKIVKQHMLQTLLQSKSPFLEVISTKDAKRMADLSTITTVPAGEVIFSEGDEAHDFNFVYSGQLSVSKSKFCSNEDVGGHGQIIAILYSGDYFGEMALLNQTKRLATIVATSTTVLISITRENFYDCFRNTPQLIAEFIVRMKGVNVDLDSLLNYSKSKAEFEHFLSSIGCHLLSCYDNIRNKTPTQSILGKYFSDEATHPIDNKEIKELFRRDMEDNCSLLDEAMSVLRKYLGHEYLPKFKNSAAFATLMERMRVYDEIDVELLA